MNIDEILSLFRSLTTKSLPLDERLAVRGRLLEQAANQRHELVQRMTVENDAGTKIELLMLIAETADPFYAEAVCGIIQSDETPEVLQTAATTLGKIKARNCLTVLAGLLKHPEPNARLGAIYGLLALGDLDGVPHLIDSLDDSAQARCWWSSPKPGGYIIKREAEIAIDRIAGRDFKGDKDKISKWLDSRE